MQQHNDDQERTEKAVATLPNQPQAPMLSREASRELDALIDEKVMGWTQSPFGLRSLYLTPPGAEAEVTRAVPHYSTDIAAAWLVVEKLMETKVYTVQLFVSDESDGWECSIDFGRFIAKAPSAMLAICLATLKAAETM